MRFLLFILITASFGSLALAEDDYFPLHVGDEWTMTFRVDPPRLAQSTGVFHRRIDGIIEKVGKTYFRSRQWTEGLSQTFTKLYRKDESGVYHIEEQIEGSTQQVELSLPLRMGKSWRRNEEATILTVSVIGLESIEVSEQSYNKCYHVRITGSNYTEDYMLALNVGLVKSEVVYKNGDKLISTLKEFKPGK